MHNYIQIISLIIVFPSPPPLSFSPCTCLSPPITSLLILSAQQLPTFLNNVGHIRNKLSKFPEELELHRLYERLEERQEVGTKCKRSVEKILQEADEEIYGYTERVIVDIADKVLS